MTTGESYPVRRGFVVQQVVRWICFAFLLSMLISVLPSLDPAYSDPATLFQDVQAGRTRTVFLSDGSSDSVGVLWSDGYAAWKRTDVQKVGGNERLTGPLPGTVSAVYGPLSANISVNVDPAWSARQQLSSSLNQVAASRTGVAVSDRGVSQQSRQRVFFFEVVGPRFLIVTAGVLWVLLFLAMLSTRYHPFANRYAWFWLFTLGGGAAGPLLYLWKEPEPLRLRPWRPRARRSTVVREPMTGGSGCLWALMVGLMVTFAAVAISYVGTKAVGWW